MSTHPVVNQLLSFVSNLTRNSYLTGKHRFVGSLASGTSAQDQAALIALATSVREKYSRSPFTGSDFINEAAYEITKAVEVRAERKFPMELLEVVFDVAFQIINTEYFMEVSAQTEGWEKNLDLKEAYELTEWLKRHQRFINNYDELFVQVSTKLIYILGGLVGHIGQLPRGDTDLSSLSFDAPLMTLMDDPVVAIERTIVTLFDKDILDAELLHETREQLCHNLEIASGYGPCNRTTFDPCKCKIPTEQKGKTPEQILELYLEHTPFTKFFKANLPIKVPEEVRFEHMHILAGTGHGKTQAMQHLIVNDLQRDPDDIPSMVILDSQGDMLNVLKRLALFDPMIENSLAKRLLIVDPSDVEYAPALNLFDIQSDRLEHHNQRDREQVLAGIIEIYDYIFGGLLGAELTQKQSMVFRFLAQLMLTIPGSTIHTLRDLLIDAAPHMQYVAKLPDTAKGFFETQFFAHGYKATREQILRRLYGVLQNQSFERMFANPKNKLDLFDVLNEGGIVLVNTAKDFLKGEASSIFGRYIIALTFKAAMERAILPEHKRRPTFLWIDEASEYFDDNIDSLLIQSRKYKLGLVMAHQYLGQLPRGLPGSLMTNTSIKLVGGISDKDSREMAREMRTTPEFIASMTKQHDQTSFGAYVRNITPQAMTLTVPFGTAEALPKMSEESFKILRAASREKLSMTAVVSGVDAGDIGTHSKKEVPPKTVASPPSSSNDGDFWEASD